MAVYRLIRLARWRSCGGRGAMLGLLLSMGGFTPPVSLAAEATLSARYRGEVSGQFENTTRRASFCSIHPVGCVGKETVDLPLSYTKRSVKGAADVRDRFYIRMPGRRTVDVTHQTTGERYRLTFEIIQVSQRVREIFDFSPLNNAGVIAGCTGFNINDGDIWSMSYLWSLSSPVSPAGCYSDNRIAQNGNTREANVYDMGIVYQLSKPAALKMKRGLYRGSLVYSAGNGGDFDFGNGVTNLNSPTLTINFELDVQPPFSLQFEPGSEQAVLEPPGGWQAWSNGGQAPERLYRDLTFRLWSGGPFKVYKLCQHEEAGRCAIRNPASHQVPITVGLSLPPGIEHGGGQVSRLNIPTGRASALAFEHMTPTLNQPGELHFQVEREEVPAMLRHAGSTYEGQVTVVFDADV